MAKTCAPSAHTRLAEAPTRPSRLSSSMPSRSGTPRSTRTRRWGISSATAHPVGSARCARAVGRKGRIGMLPVPAHRWPVAAVAAVGRGSGRTHMDAPDVADVPTVPQESDVARIPFRIAQVSDIHCGTLTFESRLMRAIVERVNAMAPDVVVVVGDLTAEGYD